MTDAYVNAKILEALEATGGDKHDAQKLLITWAMRDQQLLLGFAKPHLKDLIASRIGASFKKINRKGPEEKSLFAGEIDFLMERKTGGEKRSPLKLARPPKESSRQASVMHHIAAAFKKKS